MRMKIQKLLAALIAAGLLSGLAGDAGAAPKKKQAKSGLSAAEKANFARYICRFASSNTRKGAMA